MAASMAFPSPSSGAVKAVAGKFRNGWWFWRTEPGTSLTLRKVRSQYAIDALAVDDQPDADEDDAEDDEE